ncbi:2-amino-4-hydroxy-6-hydroxymethyldihydropteridine diphosphokinase [Gynuella sp.]|uniref:2-amino-4-hydroxy-6- hydroxymethyldihydropteridine diphosphokinase n=1 Tax=Gynuella sp. TaxID=2969146 RepID=UPI003D0D63C5
MTTTCYIALGSNLDDPAAQIEIALGELDATDHTQLVVCSSLWSSKPLGPQDQPDYINAVCQISTLLAPHPLLDWLQSIERSHHRIKTRHWGERTLDLDILIYGDQEVQTERLTIPHPQITFRNFVLLPLAEIAPQLMIAGEQVSSRAESINQTGIFRIK